MVLKLKIQPCLAHEVLCEFGMTDDQVTECFHRLGENLVDRALRVCLAELSSRTGCPKELVDAASRHIRPNGHRTTVVSELEAMLHNEFRKFSREWQQRLA